MTDFPEATPGGDALDAKRSMDEAERILLDAGWTPDDGWGGFFHGPCIGGLAPDGNMYVKNIAAIPPGHPKYSADTPDTFHEAAQWLADRYHAKLPPRIVLDEPGELGEDSGDENVRSDNRDGDAASSVWLGDHAEEDAAGASGILAPDRDESAADGDGYDAAAVGTDDGAETGLQQSSVLDADFSEPAPELGQELAEEHPEEFGGAAFIFGDNLDQKRTAAIGLVMRHARSLMPFWTTNEDVMLRELRNYAAGVGEGRWPYDEGRRRDLDALEAALARMNDIARVRDEKVSFLEQAKREEIEAFDPEAGWPQ